MHSRNTVCGFLHQQAKAGLNQLISESQQFTVQEGDVATNTQDISPQLITETSLGEYFQHSVDDALKHLGVGAASETAHYLVNLLTTFLHTEHLYERTDEGLAFKPLAMHYACAVEETSLEGRNRALQRLGDIALFIAGVFSGSLNRKLVDVDYYIAMGGSAYAHLSETSGGGMWLRALRGVFGELADNFVIFVDVLGEVSEQSRMSSNVDIMRLYELWLRTGSERAARKLRQLGIEPHAGATLVEH